MGPGKNRNSPNNTSSNQATTRGSWGEKGKKKIYIIKSKFIADSRFRSIRNAKQQNKWC